MNEYYIKTADHRLSGQALNKNRPQMLKWQLIAGYNHCHPMIFAISVTVIAKGNKLIIFCAQVGYL